MPCQADLATLSTTAEHITLTDSGHFVMVDRPDAILDALLAMINEAH